MSRRSLIRRHSAPVLLCLLLAICLLYQAYRYPFQINSSLTSPTYSNTPTWLQLGKWGLIALVALTLAVSIARHARTALSSGSRLRTVALGLELALVVLTLVRVAFGAASVEPWVLLIGATTALLVTLTIDVSGTASMWICRIVVVYSFIAVAADLVQVGLFVATGRLPALAYANSPSVRFGSVLDDPNGYAVLLAALIPTTWITLSARPNLRLAITMALLCTLPLTQSWTGVVGTVAALTVTYLFTRGLRRDLRRAAAVVVSVVVVVGVAAFFARSTIAELIRLKRGSAEDHAASFAPVTPEPAASSPAPDASILASQPAAPAAPISHATWTSGIESSYVNILVNYGPLLLVAYLALGIVAIVILLRGWTRLPLALRVGSASYLICFMLASANLGLDRTFPCNVLYFFFCGLAFASSTDRPRRRGSAQDAEPRRWYDRLARNGRSRRSGARAHALGDAV